MNNRQLKHLYFHDNGRGYYQIDKREAVKRYESGENVVFCPSNLRPGGFTGAGMIINKGIDGTRATFETAAAMFKYYNCINCETGLYIRFYRIVNE